MFITKKKLQEIVREEVMLEMMGFKTSLMDEIDAMHDSIAARFNESQENINDWNNRLSDRLDRITIDQADIYRKLDMVKGDLSSFAEDIVCIDDTTKDCYKVIDTVRDHLFKVLEALPEDKMEIINTVKDMVIESHNTIAGGIGEQNKVMYQTMLSGLSTIMNMLEPTAKSESPGTIPAPPPVEPKPDPAMKMPKQTPPQDEEIREPYKVNPADLFNPNFTASDFMPQPQSPVAGGIQFDGNGNPIPFGTVKDMAAAGSIIGGE